MPAAGWSRFRRSTRRRSCARRVRSHRYGPDFSYEHYLVLKRAAMVGAFTLGGGALIALTQLSPTRDLLLKFKDPGEGPTPEQRAKSWFNIKFTAEGGGQRIATEVSGGDPGYGETSKMLAQSALCLARDELPAAQRAADLGGRDGAGADSTASRPWASSSGASTDGAVPGAGRRLGQLRVRAPRRLPSAARQGHALRRRVHADPARARPDPRGAHAGARGPGDDQVLKRIGRPTSPRLEARPTWPGDQAVPAGRLADRHRRGLLAALSEPHARGLHRARRGAGSGSRGGLEAAAVSRPSPRGGAGAAGGRADAVAPGELRDDPLLRGSRVQVDRCARR